MKNSTRINEETVAAVLESAMGDAASVLGPKAVADAREWLRTPMVFFGDHIGVDLRGASADILKAFELRFMTLTTDALGCFYERGGTIEQLVASEDADEIMDDAALRAVQELFGGAETAS